MKSGNENFMSYDTLLPLKYKCTRNVSLAHVSRIKNLTASTKWNTNGKCLKIKLIQNPPVPVITTNMVCIIMEIVATMSPMS